jgi:hypothetical protein
MSLGWRHLHMGLGSNPSLSTTDTLAFIMGSSGKLHILEISDTVMRR